MFWLTVIINQVSNLIKCGEQVISYDFFFSDWHLHRRRESVKGKLYGQLNLCLDVQRKKIQQQQKKSDWPNYLLFPSKSKVSLSSSKELIRLIQKFIESTLKDKSKTEASSPSLSILNTSILNRYSKLLEIPIQVLNRVRITKYMNCELNPLTPLKMIWFLYIQIIHKTAVNKKHYWTC